MRILLFPLLVVLTTMPLLAEELSSSGLMCRQATEFLEVCAESTGDDYRSWRWGDIASPVWWYPPNEDILVGMKDVAADRLLSSDEALAVALGDPIDKFDLGDQIEKFDDWVVGFPAETWVYAIDVSGKPGVYIVTCFQLNRKLIWIASIGPGTAPSPEHRQAHAAFLWSIRFNERVN